MATSSSLTILTTIWPGVTDLTTSWPTAFLRTSSVNVAHDLECDVGLEQRPADLAHGLRHVAVGQRAATGELGEDAGQSVG